MTLLIGCLSSLIGITGHTSPRQRPMVKRVQRYALLLELSKIWEEKYCNLLVFDPFAWLWRCLSYSKYSESTIILAELLATLLVNFIMDLSNKSSRFLLIISAKPKQNFSSGINLKYGR